MSQLERGWANKRCRHSHQSPKFAGPTEWFKNGLGHPYMAGIFCSTGCWNKVKLTAYKWLGRVPIVTLCSAEPGSLFPWESETDENGCHGFARRSYLPSQVTDDYGLSQLCWRLLSILDAMETRAEWAYNDRYGSLLSIQWSQDIYEDGFFLVFSAPLQCILSIVF